MAVLMGLLAFPAVLAGQTLAPIASDPVLPKSDAAYLGGKTKSPDLALLLSAALPGSGQLYAGSRRGVAYLLVEAGLATGYVLTRRRAEDMRDDYVRDVRTNVKFDGAGSFDAWNLEDFEHATLFDNWHNVYTDESGQPLERVGKFYWKDREAFKTSDEQLGEAIPDSNLRLQAYDLRNRSNDRFKRARNLLGVLLFNHLVSAVDARIAAKARNARASVTVEAVQPIGPDGLLYSFTARFRL
jgi:hypothetical protein